MHHILPMKNAIQEYAWGSHTSISDLLGIKSPSEKPMAEMWLGAHPKASSSVFMNGQWISLEKVIEQYPDDILGREIAKKFKNLLPYLFKVLAAEKPLSIQVHPKKEQAESGFLRENQLKIPLDAFNRNYKDKNHKPECICALTPFWALNGFRPIDQILSLTKHLFPESLQNVRKLLTLPNKVKALKQFFNALLSLPQKEKETCIQYAVSISEQKRKSSPVYDWIVRLHLEYPKDIGVTFPSILNLVCLQPGQAMYLTAGELHAYLKGTGVELMANSDNVLRGGLTPKHVDVIELTNTLNFKEKEIEIIEPRKVDKTLSVYETPAEEFRLFLIEVFKSQKGYTSEEKRSVEILLCAEGAALITSIKDKFRIKKGESILVPAASPRYNISGTATFYRATVPYIS